MDLKEYQKLAARTRNPDLSQQDSIHNGVYGLVGETGELVEKVKKHLFHGHPLDASERQKIQSEMGDILWYLVDLHTTLGLDVSVTAQGNISKLQSRYPDRFSTEASIARVDTQDK